MPIAVTDLLDIPLERLLANGPGVDGAETATLEPVAYSSGSPATGGLYRLRGTASDGTGWSLFVKLLQSVRHWPGLAAMPPELGAAFAEEFPWRDEVTLWSELTRSTLPPGLRCPALHRLVELPDDRLVLWTEDVAVSAAPWDLDTYARAAHLLGRWNARASAPAVVEASPYAHGYGLRMYAERAVPMRGLGPLADDALWAHPWLAAHADLRAELLGLGAHIPTMLDRLDGYVQSMGHGDASPQNLLVPADRPETFVVIDISFTTPHAVGFDLGQLLVGLTHAGVVPASRLPEIADRIVPPYLSGLAEEGLAVAESDVREAFATSVMLRSGFDAVPWEWLADPAREHDVAERVALARFLLGQYAAC